MVHAPFVRDDAKYLDYYTMQAAGNLPGYVGSRVQYGNGLAGIFKALYRMAIPLFIRGAMIAKPHLKTAVKNIAGDVVSNITRAAFSKQKQQDGHGLAIITKRGKKRPPSINARSKRAKTKRSDINSSFIGRCRTKRTLFSEDIF